MATILELIEKVKSGDFPEQQLTEERLNIMDSNALTSFSIILAHCMLNEIPAENAEATYNKRRELFDEIIKTVNAHNYGRTDRIVVELEKVVSASEDDKVLWPSKRLRNNILLFVTQYFIWDNETRALFFGSIEQDANESNGEEQIIDGSDE